MAARGEVAAGVKCADVAQLAERVLGKDEVTGPIPVIGSSTESGGTRAWREEHYGFWQD